jgi:hypothetical protein
MNGKYFWRNSQVAIAFAIYNFTDTGDYSYILKKD